MSSDCILHVPSCWAAPHKKILATECDELIACNKLLRWVAETGVTTEAAAKSVFKKINAYFYVFYLYPTLPDDQKSKKLFELEVQFVVMGYMIDDVIEKYNESEMKEFISSFNFLQNQALERFPKYPSISEMKKLVSYVQKAYTKNAVVVYIDYLNKVTTILLEGGEMTEDTVMNFRTRLSNAFALYFDAMLRSKVKTGCLLSEREYLWRRSFEGVPIPMYVFTEIYSKILEKNHVLPLDLVYKLYLLGSLFSVVINDLYSYERDKFDNTAESVIKLWFNEKTAEDITAATLKVSKILNAALQKSYLLVEEGKTSHPEISELFEAIAFQTVGWMHVHHTVVPRYAASSFQITPVEIEDNMISDWLLEKDVYGHQIINQFLENTDDSTRKTTMDFLCGSAFDLKR